jgi:hypothetical protein
LAAVQPAWSGMGGRSRGEGFSVMSSPKGGLGPTKAGGGAAQNPGGIGRGLEGGLSGMGPTLQKYRQAGVMSRFLSERGRRGEERRRPKGPSLAPKGDGENGLKALSEALRPGRSAGVDGPAPR